MEGATQVELPVWPRVIGQYAIYEPIATGGMASVHYGRLRGAVGFSRTVAIKCLRPELAANAELRAMFLDEARIAARIRHPNVVATIDVVAAASEVFLVMEYVHGEPLSALMNRGGIPLPIALRITSDALQGLHAAHEARSERGIPLNIVHRDVSPQNILVGVDGIARLVDFGVANAAGQSGVSRKGTLKGKLGYMAPEQLARTGHEPAVSRQTDIHAVAVVLWEMLMGRRLFVSDSEAEAVGKVLAHDVPKISALSPEIPEAVDAVISTGLAVNVEDRWKTAEEMCVALEGCGKMASSIAVGEWMRSRVASSLALRAQAVKAIEGDTSEGVSVVPPAPPALPPPPRLVSEVPAEAAPQEPATSLVPTDPAPAPSVVDGHPVPELPELEIPKSAPLPRELSNGFPVVPPKPAPLAFVAPSDREVAPAVMPSMKPAPTPSAPRRRMAIVPVAAVALLLSAVGVFLVVGRSEPPPVAPPAPASSPPVPESKAEEPAPALPATSIVAPLPPPTASAEAKPVPAPPKPAAPAKGHRASATHARPAYSIERAFESRD
jgi:serine/threonine-protein kinase